MLNYAPAGIYSSDVTGTPITDTFGPLPGGHGAQLAIQFIDQQGNVGPLTIIGVGAVQSIGRGSLKSMPSGIKAAGPTITTSSISARTVGIAARQIITWSMTESDFTATYPTWIDALWVTTSSAGDHAHAGDGVRVEVTRSASGTYTGSIFIGAGESIDVGFYYTDQSGDRSVIAWPAGTAGNSDPGGGLFDPGDGYVGIGYGRGAVAVRATIASDNTLDVSHARTGKILARANTHADFQNAVTSGGGIAYGFNAGASTGNLPYANDSNATRGAIASDSSVDVSLARTGKIMPFVNHDGGIRGNVTGVFGGMLLDSSGLWYMSSSTEIYGGNKALYLGDYGTVLVAEMRVQATTSLDGNGFSLLTDASAGGNSYTNGYLVQIESSNRVNVYRKVSGSFLDLTTIIYRPTGAPIVYNDGKRHSLKVVLRHAGAARNDFAVYYDGTLVYQGIDTTSVFGSGICGPCNRGGAGSAQIDPSSFSMVLQAPQSDLTLAIQKDNLLANPLPTTDILSPGGAWKVFGSVGSSVIGGNYTVNGMAYSSQNLHNVTSGSGIYQNVVVKPGTRYSYAMLVYGGTSIRAYLADSFDASSVTTVYTANQGLSNLAFPLGEFPPFYCGQNTPQQAAAKEYAAQSQWSLICGTFTTSTDATQGPRLTFLIQNNGGSTITDMYLQGMMLWEGDRWQDFCDNADRGVTRHFDPLGTGAVLGSTLLATNVPNMLATVGIMRIGVINSGTTPNITQTYFLDNGTDATDIVVRWPDGSPNTNMGHIGNYGAGTGGTVAFTNLTSTDKVYYRVYYKKDGGGAGTQSALYITAQKNTAFTDADIAAAEADGGIIASFAKIGSATGGSFVASGGGGTGNGGSGGGRGLN